MEERSNWIVIKFGGTSVSSLDNWNNISTIIKNRREEFPKTKLLLVCSALSGVSNDLERIIEKSCEGDSDELVKALEERHRTFSTVVGIDFDEVLSSKFEEFKKLIKGLSIIRDDNPKLRARIMAYGEIFSTMLGLRFLKNKNLDINWVDARDYLHSYEQEVNSSRNYLEAICHCGEETGLSSTLEELGGNLFITQGFIASNEDGETVLLGRGGSDVSASYFSSKLNAKRCEIWTDVPGIFTANPRAISSARLICNLGYDEAQEIASSGAKVLHPRCIYPVQKAGIPIHIYCTGRPEIRGTVISNMVAEKRAQVKAISSKNGTMLISMDTIGMWQEVGFLANVFDCFKKHGISINQVSTSESNVTATLDEKENAIDLKVLGKLKSDLEKICHVKIIGGCSTVALVGRNIRAILHKITPALKVFEEQKIYQLCQSSTDLNLSVVVDGEQSQRLINELHDIFFKDISDNSSFGPMWNELFGEKIDEVSHNVFSPWWIDQQTSLLSMAKEQGTPCYIYNLDSVDKAAKKLTSLSVLDRVFYAMKANGNRDILKVIEKNGMGFECVSFEEVSNVIETFPKIDRKRILFTPNFSPKQEYAFALQAGVNVTLDSLYPLENWPELFAGCEVFVRIDPNVGRGHHEYVHTAGSKSKFGVPTYEIERLVELTKEHNVKVIGLHAHSGSGIRTSDAWSETAKFLLSIVDQFDSVKYLDLGGGLGVVEKRGQEELDLDLVEQSLIEIKKSCPELKFWMEPGRYCVADSGVLLAEVTQIKSKGDINYVGVNTGMNSLIRPALYGSHHEIYNLSRIERPENFVVNVVGPICESGDVLGRSRRLPIETESGDILLVSTVGAYGRVMSSHYTMRPPAKEITINHQ